ncbi:MULTISPECIES: dermonecrotic toxin domain-containing protein [Pseudomonas]
MNTIYSAVSDSRPQWFEYASAADQLHYGELEQQLIDSRNDLEKQLGRFTSLQVYAQSLMSQALLMEFGATLNPDNITTHCRYVFQQNGRTYIQEDKRSLTDLLLHGLHENGQRGQITFKSDGFLPSGLNQQWLEEVLTTDVRAAFGAEIRSVYLRAGVLAAMNNVTRDRLLLSAFAAKLQGHLNDDNLQLIRRAVAGDTSLSLAPLQLREDTRPLCDVVVVGPLDGYSDDWFLYAPGAPGGQDWHRFATFRVLDLSLSAWTATEQGRDYLVWQTHALEREEIGGYLKTIPPRPNNWRGARLAPSFYQGEEVLKSIVFNHRAWLVAQEESLTPYGYRIASDEQRQRFTRLNCELKALKTLEVRQGGFISYERFCFDLIKQRVEQVLLQRGESLAVNPDRIYVQISQEQQMTLTELIVREVHFEASGVGQPLYPRFTWATDHPDIRTLDIRDISSWSKTLRPGEKYIDMLRSVYLNRSNPEGLLKRGICIGGMRRQMTVSLMQAAFTGRIPPQHVIELEKVIVAFGSMQPTSPVGEAPGDVRHSALFKLFLRDRLVVGVFVFRLLVAGKVEEYLYTPNAPDGCELRPFKDFVPAVKTRGIGDYLYDRVFAKYQPQVGTYLTDLEQLANFTEAPALVRNSRVTDLNDCYNDVVYKIISDVDEATQSLGEIIGGLVYDAVVTAVSVISIVFAPVGIALSAALLTQNLVQGAAAYSEGDRAKAMGHFKEALIELASLGKAGIGGAGASQVQKNLIDLLGDAREVEKLYCAATGQPGLEERALEAIKEILADPGSSVSKTTLV